MLEFCPQCLYPLGSSDDEGRLCLVCCWFGDKSEALTALPEPTPAESAFASMVFLHRELCRLELTAEQASQGRPEHRDKMDVIRSSVVISAHSLVRVFKSAIQRAEAAERNLREERP